jgi:nicotinamidase-related amidase
VPAALLVIDVQKAFDDADDSEYRNNPEYEANVAALLAAWEGPRVHVRRSCAHAM